MLFFKKKSYSQCGEDLFIENFFKNKNYGTYLDIGAFNPIKFSNTLLLYKKGWKGINIDLNQTSIDLFNITAAAYTGPIKLPLPTSSTPAISFIKFEFLNLIFFF